MKILKRLLISLLIIIVLLISLFFVYLNIGQYSASENSINTYSSLAVDHGKYYEFNNDSENGFIFYPGAKVEPLAYGYLSEIENANVYIIKPFYNISFFSMNVPSLVIDENEEVSSWFIGGHSLGGVVADGYAQNNSDVIDGVILFGSYPIDKLVNNTIPYLSLYGTNDGLVGDYSEKVKLFDDNSTLVSIEGGNHSQFGDYGFQKEDKKSSISSKQQHDFIIKQITIFIKKY